MIQSRREETLAIGPLGAGDLAVAHRLSSAVHWPHRLEDWQSVHRLGIDVAAHLDGRLVGTAMAWRLGRDWARLGMVVVAPEHQGRGIGRRLTEALLPELAGRGITLHATAAGAQLYRRLGFVPCGVVCQHQGAAFSVGIAAPLPGERLRPAGRADYPTIVALDAAASGMSRAEVLAALMEVSAALVLDRTGEPAGFALLRRFGRGHLIGPVVAPDEEAARLLIGHWLGQRQGAFLRVDLADAPALSDWVQEVGLTVTDEVVHMTSAPLPAPRTGRCFALISQALG